MVFRQQPSQLSDEIVIIDVPMLTESRYLTSTGSSQIGNPATGECMTVLSSTLENNGKQVLIRSDLAPAAKAGPRHYHTNITETFTVLKGVLAIEIGKKNKKILLRPGQSVRLTPGIHHTFWNASEEEWLSYIYLIEPAMEFENFMMGIWGMERDGVRANPLQFALLVEKSDSLLVGPPVFFQQLIFGVLAWIARRLGVDRSIAKYWS